MSKPLVLFITPKKFSAAYAGIANKLTREALSEIGQSPDDVELLGYESPDSAYASRTLNYLARSGINPHSVRALLLLGEVAAQFRFTIPEGADYLLSSVVVPDLSVSFPSLCVPSLHTGWYKEPEQWESIRQFYSNLLRDGRRLLSRDDPYTFAARPKATWN